MEGRFTKLFKTFSRAQVYPTSGDQVDILVGSPAWYRLVLGSDKIGRGILDIITVVEPELQELTGVGVRGLLLAPTDSSGQVAISRPQWASSGLKPEDILVTLLGSRVPSSFGVTESFLFKPGKLLLDHHAVLGFPHPSNGSWDIRTTSYPMIQIEVRTP